MWPTSLTLFTMLAQLSLSCSLLMPVPPLAPFEGTDCEVPISEIDSHVYKALREKDITPSHLCSDEVFIRRLYLDVTGTLPTAAETIQFINDTNPNKRSLLIDQALTRPAYADYWAMKWSDLLRVKAEFPINLWPNAVQAYYHWIHEAMKSNTPMDRFAYALLTSSGSNFRNPAVNFYRAVSSKNADAIASAVALTFMGERTASWNEDKRRHLSEFFKRVTYKPTDEWKEEIVCMDPNEYKAFDVTFPDGTTGHVNTAEDPRIVFTKWLIDNENRYFAKNMVNRAWSWTMGRGIIHQADDIRPDNPPSNPELLKHLEKSFIASGYNMKSLLREILNSRTYQQSSIPQSNDPRAAELFAYYKVRRMDAEVLIDALNWIGSSSENYHSPIPEPFTFVPEEQKTVMLADGSISSQFLDMFGRPNRDTGLESERDNNPSPAQCMFLINSSQIHEKLKTSPHIKHLLTEHGNNPVQLIRKLYMGILSRYPTQAEINTVTLYFTPKKGKKGAKTAFKSGVEDLVWALINSKEFLYKH